MLDPFLGTGTTLVAAHLAGAKGVGIDIDATYIATACQRVSETVESSRRVVLDRHAMEQLFRQDGAQQEGAAWQRKLASLQERLNKTTGELMLSADDLQWIREHVSQSANGGGHKWVTAAFGRQIDLTASA